jgi:UDP-N-acetylglucosamine:LPS N-acetylglucosamine transferase
MHLTRTQTTSAPTVTTPDQANLSAPLSAGGARLPLVKTVVGKRQPKVLLVASNGGHLVELLELAGEFAPQSRHWITFNKLDANVLLAGESVQYAHGPTNRHLGNLIRNSLLAVWIVVRLRPDAVITTGAGVGVPFIYAARLFGRKAIFIESLARIDQLSMSGRLAYPVASAFFVQCPELALRYRKCRYAGALM